MNIDCRLQFALACKRADDYIDHLMVHREIGQDDFETQWFRLALADCERNIVQIRKVLRRIDPQFLAEYDREQAMLNLPLH